MPSPEIIQREPGRRVQKSGKPERREEQPVDTGDMDAETPTPSQQSQKAGPSDGRERSRRVTERAPKVAGARASAAKSHDATMMDKHIEKQVLKQADDSAD